MIRKPSFKDVLENPALYVEENNELKENLSKFNLNFNKISNLNFDKINNKIKIGCEKLLKKDWFPNDLLEIDVMITEQVDYDDTMKKFFIKNIKYIKDDIINHENINKSELINEIFLSYDEKKYFVAIPSLFILVDGCFDFNIFRKSEISKIKKKLNERLNLYQEIYKYSIDELLNCKTEFNKAGEKNRQKNINRHKILHGNEYSYGTEINFYKILSLYYFLICFRERYF